MQTQVTDNSQQVVNREKRFEVNELVGIDAIVSRLNDDGQYYAELIDFSRHGVKFSLPFNARFDETLDIDFRFKSVELHYTGTGRVRHIRNIGDNRWQVGCSIDPAIPEDVISYLAKQNNQERRKEQRTVVELRGKIRRQGQVEAEDATIHNISKGGFCAFVHSEHEVGDSVEFETLNQKGEGVAIVARVKWKNPVEGGYKLGCRFGQTACYAKLCECFEPETPEPAVVRFKWHMLATALFVFLFPTLSFCVLFPPSSQSAMAERLSASKADRNHPQNPIEMPAAAGNSSSLPRTESPAESSRSPVETLSNSQKESPLRPSGGSSLAVSLTRQFLKNLKQWSKRDSQLTTDGSSSKPPANSEPIRQTVVQSANHSAKESQPQPGIPTSRRSSRNIAARDRVLESALQDSITRSLDLRPKFESPLDDVARDEFDSRNNNSNPADSLKSQRKKDLDVVDVPSEEIWPSE